MFSVFAVTSADRGAASRGAACAPQPASRRHRGAWPRIGLALALAMLTGVAPRPAEAVVLSCFQLKQNCESHIARLTRILARTRPDHATRPSDDKELSVDRCDREYMSAKQSGIWPGHGATPALPCTQ